MPYTEKSDTRVLSHSYLKFLALEEACKTGETIQFRVQISKKQNENRTIEKSKGNLG